MSHNKTYLITGANRGIGKALLKTYLSHPSTTVIAAVRTPDSPSTLNLQSLPTGPNSNLIIVKIDSNSETDAKAAITHLQTEHGIKKLDVVIANAGIASYNKSGETSPEQMREHFAINTIGPLVLFQACLPLLLPSGSSNSTSSESHTGETEQKGIFTAISSLVGSISSMGGLPLQSTAYGSSKAALNYVVRKIHFEYPDICAFVINPGWVQTDMGNEGANLAGMQQAPDRLEDVVRGITGKIDGATRESIGGTFASFDGAKVEW